MSMTKNTEPLRILKQKPYPCAPPSVLYISCICVATESHKLFLKELCDHDNYFWTETNRNSNLIARNVGCKKRKEVRKERKWKPSTGIPRRSPIQLRILSDRASLRCSTITNAFHTVWLDKGKEPNFYLVFRKKKRNKYLCS